MYPTSAASPINILQLYANAKKPILERLKQDRLGTLPTRSEKEKADDAAAIEKIEQFEKAGRQLVTEVQIPNVGFNNKWA